MRHPETVYNSFRRGDGLEDDELKMLKGKMHTLADLAGQFGPMFEFTRREAMRVYMECECF